MPLSNAVLDFHPLGIVDTPAGPRQRVVLVAAQRDMVERLLAAVRRAGLSAEGVDLSAFALIRSLYRPDAEQVGRVLYLNVDGLTNLAIAEGRLPLHACRRRRSRGDGDELAERRSSPWSKRARCSRTWICRTATPAAEPAAPAGPASEPEPVADEPRARRTRLPRARRSSSSPSTRRAMRS